VVRHAALEVLSRVTFAGRCVGLLLACLAGCATPAAPQIAVAFIGAVRLPAGLAVGGMPVGGLSAIDYDSATGRWVLFSDDRSEHAPARAYQASLAFDRRHFHGVAIEGVTVLRRDDGTPYPAPRPGATIDIEAGRVDPVDGSWWYASEGQPSLLRHADVDGLLLEDVALPEALRGCTACVHGARINLGIEGLAFAPDGRTLWLALEAPLWQDGGLPTPQHGALARITRLDRSGRQLAQYAYPLDAIPVAPAPGRLADNGISEVLAIDSTRLLVLERSGSQDAAGRFAFHVRLYEAAIDDATDVAAIGSLAGATVRPMRKRLLLDAGTLPLAPVDNLEGMAWGPPLADGSASLVLVSDDNFSAAQVTQFLLFAVRGRPPVPIK
jgi:hypothetical protein